MQFERYAIQDVSGTGREAAHLLIPSGWRAEGHVIWRFDAPAFPATMSLRVTNPAGVEEFRLYPDMLFTWGDAIRFYLPVGSRYLGAEVAPPPGGPIECLKRVVLPRLRYDVARRARVIAEREFPGPSAAIPGVAGGWNDTAAAQVRIEYDLNGMRVQEDLYCTLTLSRGGAITNWFLNPIMSFRAEKGRLDDLTPMFQAIRDSMKVDPEWYQSYRQVAQSLIQGESARQGAVMKQVQIQRQANDEVTKIISETYQNRQATLGAIALCWVIWPGEARGISGTLEAAT
jgi:hypothetical protein